ncbi:ankyrin [Massarina eburnea CBS 473.64]|uniref:Ankyrin n=1 Tax=Massarina eburnea CBS 473.64 TaxID=1395130 RepID=A0A6A6RKB1_9PLEO|nr:ankyrin [Massarina eburnea CBS 473.64]
MAKRKAEDELWEEHKEELYQLYEINSETLASVIEHMKSRKGFERSKPQYERMFKKWKFKKRNVTRKEWEYIEHSILEREANGKILSSVRINGVPIPDIRIRKQRKRYATTTFERQQLMLNIAPRPATPPGLEIYTPMVLSPGLQPVTMPCPDTYTSMMLSPASRDISLDFDQESSLILDKEKLFASAEMTPWRDFLRLFSTLSISGPSHNGMTLVQSTDSRNTQVATTSPFNRLEDLLLWNEFMHIEVLETSFHPAVLDPTPYLPQRQDGSSDIDLKTGSDISPVGRQLQLLKHVVYLLSNNLNVRELAPIVVEFTREKQNRDFLKRLLLRGEFTMKAIAEKLLLPAVKGRNYPLLNILLDSGVDINCEQVGDRISHEPYSRLLHHAIDSCDEGLVQFLLHHGATLGSRSMQQNDYWPWRQMVIFAIKRNNVSIVNHLVQRMEQLNVVFHKDIFIAAAYNGHVSVFDLLVSKQRDQFESFRKEPWVLYEAAAFGGDISTLETLRAKGLEIHATNDFNEGSPLTFAIIGGHIKASQFLLKVGCNIHTYACGEQLFRNMGTFEIGSKKTLYAPGTFEIGSKKTLYAPIHGAVHIGATNIVSHLINKGVDPNQSGIRSPLQLAAAFGHMEIARLLIEAGADADDVSPHNPDPFSFVHPTTGRQHFVGASNVIRIALEVGDEEMFDLFVEHGAWLPNKTSRTCMRHQDTLYLKEQRPKSGTQYSDILDCISQHSVVNDLSTSDVAIIGHCSEDKSCHCDSRNKDCSEGDEFQWNLLLNAACGRNAYLFSRVLDVAIAKGRPWMTPRCLSMCVKTFPVDFIKTFTSLKLFRLFPSYEREIMFASIMTDLEDLLADIIRNQELTPGDISTGFCYAVALQRVGMVQTFLDIGCWPDDHGRPLDDDYGARILPKQRTPLGQALGHENKPIIRLMFNHYQRLVEKVEESIVKNHLMQAYGIAIKWGNMQMLELFASTIGGNIVIHEVFDYLGDSRGQRYESSVIHFAAHCQQYEVVNWLLNHGDSSLLDESNNSDIEGTHSTSQCVVRDGKVLLLKRLLEKGVDVNARPAIANGATALQFAAITNRFDILDLLIGAGAHINASPGEFEGRSAIEGAAEFGRLDMAKYLLGLGAGEGIKGKGNINYARTICRAWRHGHHALARMVHHWKVENDDDYSKDHDSIEAVLRDIRRETLIFAKGYEIEYESLPLQDVCITCVPDWDPERKLVNTDSEVVG